MVLGFTSSERDLQNFSKSEDVDSFVLAVVELKLADFVADGRFGACGMAAVCFLLKTFCTPAFETEIEGTSKVTIKFNFDLMMSYFAANFSEKY